MARRNAIILIMCAAALLSLSFWQTITRVPGDSNPLGRATFNSPNALAAAQQVPQEGVIDARSYGAVGDGITDDTAAIRAAVNAARPGGCVFFPVGTYVVRSRIICTQPITWLGVGDGSTVQYDGGDIGADFRADNTTIQSLRFCGTASSGLLFGHGATLADPKTNIRVTACTFESPLNQCIWLWNVDGVQITGCMFHTGYGVIAQYATHTLARNVTVSGNTFRGWDRDGIAVNLDPSVAGYSAGWVISNNVFDTHADWGGTPSVESRAMSFASTKDCTITGNRIQQVECTTGAGAIHFEASSGQIIFANNHLEDLKGNGWLEIITSNADLQIVGNVFRCTASGQGATNGMIRMADAAYTSQVSIVGNRFTQGDTARDATGIRLTDSADSTFQIVGNRFERMLHGIWGKTSCRRLQVCSNYFYGCAYGVQADPVAASGGGNSYWLVASNYFYDTQTRDINVNRNTNGTSPSGGWLVQGNYCDAAGIFGGGTTGMILCNNYAPTDAASFTLGGSGHGQPSTGYMQYGNRNQDSDAIIKTITKTINISNANGDGDYAFDNAQANRTRQVKTLTSILPAYGQVLSWQVRCFESVTGNTPMTIELGATSSGTELGTGSCSAVNTILGTPAGHSPTLPATNGARNLYFSATPEANWNTLGQGRWAVMITYVDNGAAYTQRAR